MKFRELYRECAEDEPLFICGFLALALGILWLLVMLVSIPLSPIGWIANRLSR